jgi:hypothetical protein
MPAAASAEWIPDPDASASLGIRSGMTPAVVSAVDMRLFSSARRTPDLPPHAAASKLAFPPAAVVSTQTARSCA